MQAPVGFVELDFVAGRYTPEELVRASPGRRLVAAILDGLLQGPGLVLIYLGLYAAIFTFGLSLTLVPVGLVLLLPWFIWFVIVAPNGQTPGKQLLGEYILREDGSRAGGVYVWYREFFIKSVVFSFLSAITFGVLGILGPLWCLWDKNSQCLWDKLATTYVAYSPFGFKPATMNEMVTQGLPRRWPGAPGPAQQQPQIIINNNNNAQIGNNDNRHLNIRTTLPGHAGGRVGVIDRGHPLPDLSLSSGQALLIGRDAQASVVLSDPKASRRHAEITLEGSVWVVRDLGAMNPTRILSANGGEAVVGGATRRLEHGQLAIGDSVITLYPVGR
ncbi:MAG: RDD family protein [Dehalococcoidia bacterium]|nr:RDD family protein [Dehalococcoidia bacterium]